MFDSLVNSALCAFERSNVLMFVFQFQTMLLLLIQEMHIVLMLNTVSRFHVCYFNFNYPTFLLNIFVKMVC